MIERPSPQTFGDGIMLCPLIEILSGREAVHVSSDNCMPSDDEYDEMTKCGLPPDDEQHYWPNKEPSVDPSCYPWHPHWNSSSSGCSTNETFLR